MHGRILNSINIFLEIIMEIITVHKTSSSKVAVGVPAARPARPARRREGGGTCGACAPARGERWGLAGPTRAAKSACGGAASPPRTETRPSSYN